MFIEENQKVTGQTGHKKCCPPGRNCSMGCSGLKNLKTVAVAHQHKDFVYMPPGNSDFAADMNNLGTEIQRARRFLDNEHFFRAQQGLNPRGTRSDPLFSKIL